MGTWHAYERSSTSIPATPDARARTFHESLNDYKATALIDLLALADELSIGRVVAKDESTRLGLPAFKALGASWAIHRATEVLTGPLTIATATDGNHGRAVARFARTSGHSASIFTPDGVHPSAVQAIRDEGARVEEVGGSYDDAVAAAASAATAPGHVLLQDTAWEGYEQIPVWIVVVRDSLRRSR